MYIMLLVYFKLIVADCNINSWGLTCQIAYSRARSNFAEAFIGFVDNSIDNSR